MAKRPARPDRILKQHEIPRIAERLIQNKLMTDLERNSYDYLRAHHLLRRRLWTVTRGVWGFHLRGKGVTALELSRYYDLPRGTVSEWLEKLLTETDIIVRSGTRYYVAEKYLKDVTLPPGQSLVDRQNKIILDAADAIRALNKK